MRQLFTLIITLIFAQTIHAQSINGVVFDEKTLEGLPFANVILIQDDEHIAGTTCDLDGNYHFSDVKEGIYDIEVVYVGYPNKKITGVNIGNVNVEINAEMSDTGVEIPDCCCVRDYSVPLIDLQNTSTGQSLSASDIKRRF